MKLTKFIAACLLFSLSGFANAATVQCSNLKVSEVTVESNRDDGFSLSNKVVIKFNGLCSGVSLGYIANTHAASLHFLQIALAAKTTNAKVAIAYNTSKPAINNNNGDTIAYELGYLAIQD